MSERGRRGRPWATRAGLALLLATSAAPGAAHWVEPEQVIARLLAPETRARFGITEVQRHAGLARLLVVRVDRRWRQAEPELRRESAEEWLRLWREAVPQGVLAIVDPGDRSLVRFDGNGRAALVSGAEE